VTLFLAGNKYLANYAENSTKMFLLFPVRLTRTSMPVTKQDRNDKTVCIGWTGSPSTIKHFIQGVPVLKRIKEKFGERVSFKIIGD